MTTNEQPTNPRTGNKTEETNSSSRPKIIYMSTYSCEPLLENYLHPSKLHAHTIIYMNTYLFCYLSPCTMQCKTAKCYVRPVKTSTSEVPVLAQVRLHTFIYIRGMCHYFSPPASSGASWLTTTTLNQTLSQWHVHGVSHPPGASWFTPKER